MIGSPKPVLELLARCPNHRTTPLIRKGNLWLKDETDRMGLGSFKALGGAYAVYRLLRKSESPPTFCCATAGNHGLSVAAGASAFGGRAVIYLSHAVSQAFERRLLDLGAEVVREGAGYDQSMLAALQAAERHGWTLVSDSSWPGYLEIPTWIMQGYSVIAWETARQLEGERPRVVYLQAGVGGLAAAAAEHIRLHWTYQPRIVVVEPEWAACLRASHRTGRPTVVTGPVSNMARLDCKEPSLLAFEALRRWADEFETVSDTEATDAVDWLHDSGIKTTPSGAAGVAAWLRNRDARALAVVTEGA